MMQALVEMLHRERCSCVISTGGNITICRERGVKDLYRLLSESPDVLNGALVADKVVGKGAAALMAMGKVEAVYADVISQPALSLLRQSGIAVDYAQCVPNIINRAGTGICPVEALCADASTPEDCLPLIANFINKINK